MEILIGGLLVLIGIRVGRISRPKPPEVTQPDPVCGCTHNLAFHDPSTGECHGTHKVQRYSVTGGRVGFDYTPCGCRQYMGPIPFNPTTLLPMIDMPTTYTAPSLSPEQREQRRARGR